MKTNRRRQILEVLASELETKPGSRVTTATLALAVGVSEAALYRLLATSHYCKIYYQARLQTVDARFGRITHDQ